MTHRKRIERLEENIRALVCAGSQAVHNRAERDYLAHECERLQRKYVQLTGKKYYFDDQIKEDSA